MSKLLSPTFLLLILATTTCTMGNEMKDNEGRSSGTVDRSKDPKPMKISLNVVNGSQMFPLKLEQMDSIEMLKALIIEKAWIPMDQQRLLYNGQVMQNGQNLGEYSVVDGAIIDLIKRG